MSEAITFVEGSSESASTEEIESHQKELEAIANPIMQRFYAASGAGAGGPGGAGGFPGGGPGGFPGGAPGGFPGAGGAPGGEDGPSVEEVD